MGCLLVFPTLQKEMGVSKNRGFTPKWMVKIMENPTKMDDLGGNPHYFRKHPHLSCWPFATWTRARSFGVLLPGRMSGLTARPGR